MWTILWWSQTEGMYSNNALLGYNFHWTKPLVLQAGSTVGVMVVVAVADGSSSESLRIRCLFVTRFPPALPPS